MIDAQFMPFFQNADDVKSNINIQFVLFNIMVNCSNNSLLLLGFEKCFWSAKKIAGTGLDFNSHQGVVLYGNNIHLGFEVSVISLQNMIPICGQKFCRRPSP